MASQEKLTGRLHIGKGSKLEFKCDDSKPSPYNYWVECSYDGLPDSHVTEVGAHWHKHHDEKWQVISGRLSVLVGDKWTIVSPSDGLITVPRLTVHGFKFLKGEKAMFREWTDPPGDFKEKFFEDLLDDGEMRLISALRAAYDGDTYFALPGGFRWLDTAFMLGFGALAKWLFPKRNDALATKGLSAPTE